MSPKYILLNHATGDFFIEYHKDNMERVIDAQIRLGNDLEDLQLIYGKRVEIKEIPVFNTKYEISTTPKTP